MKILCTLGPSSFSEEKIKKLADLGVGLFRINLSHTKIADVEQLINDIRNSTDVPICLDTEGAQVRTGDFKKNSWLVRSGEEFYIPKSYVVGDPDAFNLYPLDVVDQLNVGSLLDIDFNAVLAIIIRKDSAGIWARVINGGRIGQNKAVTVNQNVELSAMTSKDKMAMAIGKAMRINYVALSFAHRASDVDEIRADCMPGVKIISKIECKEGLENLEPIIQASDEILIDRGDLSREIPVEQVPIWQKKIIRLASFNGKPAHVATNLLESMVLAPVPTRAEINDIYNTIVDGASGLVLAAETAIGKYPIECVSMIKRVVSVYKDDINGSTGRKTPPLTNVLPEPHGGQLVDSIVSYSEQYKNLPIIDLSNESLSDIEQIACGAFSPLRGFMGKNDMVSVLESNRLTDGAVWTLPIILQVNGPTASILNGKEEVIVQKGGAPHSLLHIKAVEKVDFLEYVQLWFGTDDNNHPGVSRLLAGGEYIVECDVYAFSERVTSSDVISYTPSQLRSIFRRLGWARVAGFHTRNVPHAAHEYIQEDAVRREGLDGLLISPVIGSKKEGDFESDVIMDCYGQYVKEQNKVRLTYFLSAFNTYSRYAGPRESVFTALCRKNMGCTHFIVGRDHTGVGTYYSTSASQDIFVQIGDLGIEPIFFSEIAYSVDKGGYEAMGGGDYVSISGTQARNELLAGNDLPEWYMNTAIQQIICDRLRNGQKVFV